MSFVQSSNRDHADHKTPRITHGACAYMIYPPSVSGVIADAVRGERRKRHDGDCKEQPVALDEKVDERYNRNQRNPDGLYERAISRAAFGV